MSLGGKTELILSLKSNIYYEKICENNIWEFIY